MRKLTGPRRVVTVLAALAVVLAVGLYTLILPRGVAKAEEKGKSHRLAATL